MQKIIYIFLALLLFISCDKLPDDKELDGMWQLVSIQHSGEANDVKSEQIYWSFRLRLVQFTNVAENVSDKKEFFAHSEHAGNVLTIYDLCNPSENATEADNNEWLEANDHDLAKLAKWGIFPEPDTEHKGKLKATYTITESSSSKLVLSDKSTILIFRKF